MPDPHATPPLQLAEYKALRATIRERGTLRATLVAVVLVSWAALLLTIQVLLPMPVWTLVPLLVLATGFEVAFALHVGVERIGRYVQVHYERGPDPPQWEHSAMELGHTPTPAAGRIDPLFGSLFVAACLLNLVPVVLATAGLGMRDAGLPLEFIVELVVYGSLHLAFIVRVARARRYAADQRALDLEAFRGLSD